ncbi:MAG: hypothetical protein PVI88_00355 [Nitrosopumilaceae archaeon]|jgi:hypothetical protein
MFNAKAFCEDYDITIPDTIKNTQEGWVNICCPFCDDRTNHGGINIDGGYYYCWKCGWHPLYDLILELTNSNPNKIIQQYSRPFIQKKKRKKKVKELKLPAETIPLQKPHKDYLIKRNLNPEQLVIEWNIKGTDIIGPYSYRILAPIEYKKRIVSYQARDITGKSSLRYKACKIDNEIIQHKHIVYGIDKIKNKTGILVEGLIDVWKIGPGAVCTFGTAFTIQQVRFIIKHFDRIFILYDQGQKAQKKAKELSYQLSPFIDVELLKISGKFSDPGNMTNKEVSYLRKHTIKKWYNAK